MAADRFTLPFQQLLTATPTVRVGHKLKFYASGTSTPLAVYTDSALSAGSSTTVTLNALGQPDVAIFLQNLAYKVVCTDENDVEIWTADPVYGAQFSTVAQVQTVLGTPTGQLAGTQGSVGVPASMAWDATNSILYVCTATGTSLTAVWTAINASTAAAVVPAPQGRLTLTSGAPFPSVDTATSTVYYTPYCGNLVPIYNGASFVPLSFSELSLGLVGSHSSDTIYDVFAFNNSGVVTLVTGPAWTSSTAGSGSRGTGAGTTQLTRISGLYVNTVSMTGRNGSNTYSIGANLATYLGSILIAASAGQINCHAGYGTARQWGVWNAFNRLPIVLREGDPALTWTYGTIAWRAANNNANNKITTFCGLAEEHIDVTYITISSATNLEYETAIGVNSASAPTAFNSTAGTTVLLNTPQVVHYTLSARIGVNTITALESVESFLGAPSNATLFGTELAMELKAQWNG